MGVKLPKKFIDVPLGDLWSYVRIGDELSELHSDFEDKAYWDGWHDCIAQLLGDLTHVPTITRRTELARTFVNFQMEEKLLQMEEEMKGM